MHKIRYKIISMIVVFIIIFNISSNLIFAVTEEIENNEIKSNISNDDYLKEYSEEKIEGDFKYKVYNSEYATITRYIGSELIVNIPESIGEYPVLEIGDSAFYDCKELKKINMPDGTEKIGDHAFYNCTNLVQINLPDSIEELGGGAFRNCTNLESINYPKNLRKVSAISLYGVFDGCTKLTKIEIPEGITKIPEYAFKNSKLEEVIMANTIREIGDSAFYDCKELKKINMPDGTEKIGDYAFNNCTSLTEIELPNSILEYGKELFKGCNNLIIIRDGIAKVDINFINDNIRNFRFKNNKKITESVVLDDTNSSYVTNFSSTYNDGSIAITCEYVINENMLNLAESISIKIPYNAELIGKSLYLNNELCQNYKEDESYNIITIPISEAKGRITFNVKMIKSGDILSYAVLNYRNDYDIIGIINNKADTVSIQTASITESKNIEVSGVAGATQEVEIYVDDILITTVETNKVGSYKVNIELPNVLDGNIYTLKAKVLNENEEEVYATAQTKYSKQTPLMTSFKMSYGDDTYDLLKETPPTIIFTEQYNESMSFEIKFTNPKNVGNVYVTSDRNNNTKRIKAVWNEEKQAFVTNGYFDNDFNYVPGKLNVYYTDINTMTEIIENMEIDKKAYDEIFENANAEVVSGTEDNYEVKITLKDDSTLTIEGSQMTIEEALVEMLGKEGYEELLEEQSINKTRTISAEEPLKDYLKRILKKKAADIVKKYGISVSQDLYEYIYFKGENYDKDVEEKTIFAYVWDTEKNIVKKEVIKETGKLVTTTFIETLKTTLDSKKLGRVYLGHSDMVHIKLM